MYRKNLDAAFLAAASTPGAANPLVTATENPLEEVANVVKLKTGFGTNGFTVGTESTEIAKTVTGGGQNSKTVLLLHGDEDPLTDAIGKTVTATGGAARSSTQKKFGGYSVVFDGSDNLLTIPASTDFDLAGDFTVDFWIYPTSTVLANTYFCGPFEQGAPFDSGWVIGTAGSSASQLRIYSQEGNAVFTISFTTNVWQHVRVCRASGSMFAFLNGAALTRTAAGTTFSGASDSNDFQIGQVSSTGVRFAGYIDEFRVQKGVAESTEAFTPPTSAYSEAFTSADFVAAGSISFGAPTLKVTVDGTERVAAVPADLAALDLVFTGADGAGIQYSFNADGVSDFTPATPMTATAFIALAGSVFQTKTHLFLKFTPIADQVITAPKISTASTATVMTKTDGFSVQLNSVKVFEAQADGDVIAADISADDITLSGKLTQDNSIVNSHTVTTSDATATDLFAIAMAADSGLAITLDIVAKQNGGITRGGYKLTAIFRKTSDPEIFQIGTTVSLNTAESTTALGVAFVIDGTTGIKVQVTGETATSITWYGNIQYHTV